MQISPFNHHGIASAFDLILARKPFVLEGYTFKHDQHFDGKCTLFHMFCVDNSTGKAIWHAWRVLGAAWSEDLTNRALVNRLFSLAEMVSFEDILYYDPMHMIHLPHRHKASSILTAQSFTRPNGFVRQGIMGGGMAPQYVNTGNYVFPQCPSDYPFMPGPGLPLNPYQNHPFPITPQQQHERVAYFSNSRNAVAQPNAARTMLNMLSADDLAFLQLTLVKLENHLNDSDNWIWAEDKGKDPATAFLYEDSKYPQGTQLLFRRAVAEHIKKLGYAFSWSTPDMHTTKFIITVDLSLEAV
jgi:hypothetical protein